MKQHLSSRLGTFVHLFPHESGYRKLNYWKILKAFSATSKFLEWMYTHLCWEFPFCHHHVYVSMCTPLTSSPTDINFRVEMCSMVAPRCWNHWGMYMTFAHEKTLDFAQIKILIYVFVQSWETSLASGAWINFQL